MLELTKLAFMNFSKRDEGLCPHKQRDKYVAPTRIIVGQYVC